ncbi:AAA_28 domain-containing protein [Tenacibaculum sp. 190524A02b]|uniref:AAA_28 domain-containing protein n=1 Tax=Tenacibaculum vairaonense TaxID=3137860 RepID=A0ABM9PIX6_9FLAO
MKRYIITGAPSTGKTSLINALQKEGHLTFEEVSRRIILEEQKRKGTKTPWEDVVGFTQLVYQKTIEELNTPIANYAFVDRGLPDNIAYLALKKHPITKELLDFKYTKHYHTTVFVLPIWEEIYVQDAQRLQSFEEATKIHHLLISTYQKLGFTTVLLPKNTIESRVQSIAKIIQ